MNKKGTLIRFFSIFGLLILLAAGAVGASAATGGSSIYLPLVMKNYESWSTNFADVTDPGTWGIVAGDAWSDASVSMDTSNVNSGGKSVKPAGTVKQAWDWLYLSFNLQNLAGVDSIDLSQKTISFETYVPIGSPLYFLYVDVYSWDPVNQASRRVRVRVVMDDVYLGQWHTYSADVREDILLKSWRTRPEYTDPSTMTDDQALDVLKHAQAIAITAQVPAAGCSSQSAYFLVDRLGWASSGPAPVYDPGVDSLRKFTSASLPLGGWFYWYGPMDLDYLSHFVQEFNLIATFETFPKTEPAGDVFTYDPSWSTSADADYYQETYGIPLIRYAISGDPAWIPDWLPGKSYAEAQSILEQYVQALVAHYKGKTFIWNLFNELLRFDLDQGPYSGLGLKDRNSTPQTHSGNYSPWASSPSDLTMIEDAFRIARAADPNALLIFNEPSSVEGDAEGDAAYTLAAKLKADDTPLDAVGLQTHFMLGQDDQFHSFSSVSFDPTYGFTDIAENVERFAALGLKVVFSEVDIPIYLADIDTSTQAGRDLLAHRRQLQADAYRSLLHIALTHPNVIAYNIWDWPDEYTAYDPANAMSGWNGYGKDCGLFDQVYQKKPSYYALLDELKAAHPTLPGAFTRTGPAEGATDQPTSLTLSWSPSVGTIAYQYCLAEGVSDHCDSWVSTGTNTNVSLNGLKLKTIYSWEVRALGPGGVTHANSGNWGTFKTVNGSDWSTNFVGMTDLSARGIYGNGNSVSLDTTNVNSGGKSVKLTAMMGTAGSNFDLGLWLDKLIGKTTFDYTQKTISYEVYLPADSPLDMLDFYLSKYISKDCNFVDVIQASGADLHKGQWHTYTVDINHFIATQGWKASGWTNCTTDDQVLYVLKNATNFDLYGYEWTNLTPAPTTLLLDKVGWVSSPSSATNLAKDGAATASSSLDNSTLPANAVDGDVTTRWASATTGSEWLQVDLGAVHSIQKIMLNWEGSDYATFYQIEVSDNGSDWTSVYSTTSGSGYVESLPVSTSGRYVRLVLSATSSASGYSLWEFEVY